MKSWPRHAAVLSVLVVSLFASLTVMSESASAATECSNASIVNKSYTLIGPSGVRTVPDMTGQVRQGDTVMLQFTVAPFFISECTVSLVSYTAPLNKLGTKRFLTEARRKVWDNARRLDVARRRGSDAYDARLRELEELSAARVADLRAPGQVLLKLALRGFGVQLPESPVS